MSYTVYNISDDDLIDALEEKVGGIYEHIKEGDHIESIYLTYRTITIVIGKEEEVTDAQTS